VAVIGGVAAGEDEVIFSACGGDVEDAFFFGMLFGATAVAGHVSHKRRVRAGAVVSRNVQAEDGTALTIDRDAFVLDAAIAETCFVVEAFPKTGDDDNRVLLAFRFVDGHDTDTGRVGGVVGFGFFPSLFSLVGEARSDAVEAGDAAGVEFTQFVAEFVDVGECGGSAFIGGDRGEISGFLEDSVSKSDPTVGGRSGCVAGAGVRTPAFEVCDDGRDVWVVACLKRGP